MVVVSLRDKRRRIAIGKKGARKSGFAKVEMSFFNWVQVVGYS